MEKCGYVSAASGDFSSHYHHKLQTWNPLSGWSPTSQSLVDGSILTPMSASSDVPVVNHTTSCSRIFCIISVSPVVFPGFNHLALASLKCRVSMNGQSAGPRTSSWNQWQNPLEENPILSRMTCLRSGKEPTPPLATGRPSLLQQVQVGTDSTTTVFQFQMHISNWLGFPGANLLMLK